MERTLYESWCGNAMYICCCLVGGFVAFIIIDIAPHQNPVPTFLRGLFGEILGHNRSKH